MKKVTKRVISYVLALAFVFGTLIVNTGEVQAAAGVSYRTYVQSHGWQSWVKNGAKSGTSGESKRLEGIQIKLSGVTGDISYRTYVQTYGWRPWTKNGAFNGTKGEGKRIEAIQIKLSGNALKNYDVYYRVYAQGYGWLGWAKNGASAGTSGMCKRLEAIQIRLVKKGGKAPGSTANAFRKGIPVTSISMADWKYNDLFNNTITKGYSKQLDVTYAPSNTTDKITYSSSNTAVATVSQTGLVTGVGSGIATITVKSTSGKKATKLIMILDNIYYGPATNDINDYSEVTDAGFAIDRAYYSGSNLVVEAYLYNKSTHHVVDLRDVNISMIDSTGAVIAAKYYGTMSAGLAVNSLKLYTFTFENVPPRDIAKGLEITITGSYSYYY